MTRDQAKDIIAAALVADAHSDSTANACSDFGAAWLSPSTDGGIVRRIPHGYLFAQQLATALDALGLLDYAISNEQRAAAQMSAAATSNTSELAEPSQQDQPTDWATKRSRS